MKRLSQILFLVSTFSALFLANGCMMRSTGPTEVGVRVRKLSLFGRKGVDERVYESGSTYFFAPFINDFYTFDIAQKTLDMMQEKNRGDRRVRDDLLFKTIDGNDISLDIVITYRIDPKKVTYILQYIAPNDSEIKEHLVRTIARSRTRDIFGELKTEEFYVSQSRTEKAQKAKRILNEMLNPYGIIVERVLPRDYRFNAAYQKAIEDKKIADQFAEQNKSAAKAAEQEYLKKLQDIQGDVNKIVAQVDGEFLQAKIEADAYFDKQVKIAEAIESEGIAEAKGIQKMNEALMGSGGEVMVKLKIAEMLLGKKILLLPVSGSGLDLRTMDLNKLLATYGIQKAAGSPGS